MDVVTGYSAEAFSESQIHLPSGFWWAEGNKRRVNSGTGGIFQRTRGCLGSSAAGSGGRRGVESLLTLFLPLVSTSFLEYEMFAIYMTCGAAIIIITVY